MLQKKKDEKENINKIDQLSSRIKKLLSLTQTQDLEHEEIIQKISVDYQHLTGKKHEYCTFTKEECSKKELLKEESFKTSKLNTKLHQFKGP